MAEGQATPELLQEEEEDQGLGGGEEEEEKEKGGEEDVYNLLFQECDSQGHGMVRVDSLVDYIRQIQLGTRRGSQAQEEVYDSQEDIQQLQYNLQLLKAMLECSAQEGQVDQATYRHVITLWVKDVRERKLQQETARPALEVHQLSESEEEEADGFAGGGGEVSETSSNQHLFSYGSDESFETTGGNSSTHSAIDLLSSLHDARQDNRRLIGQTEQLQSNLTSSESQIRHLQAENDALQRQIRGLQQQLNRLEEVERTNSELSETIQVERSKCEELTENTDKMSQQLDSFLSQVSSLQSQVGLGETEMERLEEEGTSLRTLLLNKENLLSQRSALEVQLQTRLDQVTAEAEDLKTKVEELAESNDALRSENLELHSSAHPLPLSSTPARSAPPSLMEEISRDGSVRGLLSPLVGRVSVDDHLSPPSSSSSLVTPSHSSSLTNSQVEDLEQMAQHSSNKFHSKTDVMLKLLNELMSSPSLTSSSSSPHSLAIREKTIGLGSKQQKEGNLRQLMACVKKLYSEKKQLKKRVSDLEEMLRQAQAKEETVNPTQPLPPLSSPPPSPPPPHTTPKAVQTTPPVVLLVGKSTQTALYAKSPSSSSSSSNKTRRAVSLAWSVLTGLSLILLCLVLLLLLLLFLALLQDSLHSCGSHCPLSPNGLAFSLLEPLVQVSRGPHTPI